jgi:prevent-host-death family protein
MAVEIGVREFRARLSHWLDRAAGGEELIVTERGRPRVRVTGIGQQTTRERLIAEGILTPAKKPRGSTPLPEPIPIKGSIADILRDVRGRY